MPVNEIQKTSMADLNRLSVEAYKISSKTPLVLVLDNLRSLQNVGSFFRTADAFRLEKILLCGITGTPPNKEIEKTALGATESVDYEYFQNSVDAIQSIKKEGFTIICIEQSKQSIELQNFTFAKHQKTAFVFGNEVFGIGQETLNAADHVLEIPQFGTKHSLNVSVTAGIVLWDYYLKNSLNLFSKPS